MRSITLTTRLLFFIFIVATGTILHAQDSLQHIEKNRTNADSQVNKPYLIVISADGFRYDYAMKYRASNLLTLAASGVKAESMIPSFPSVTFSNHYSIATGLYPAHHGLVYNQFYDRKRNDTYNMSNRTAVEDGSWYGGTPFWVLAEEQGLLSASYYFVGTEADIDHFRPTYWYRFAEEGSIDARIETIIKWLQLPEAIRPHLITFYMSAADHSGHEFGPETPETETAVHFIDSAIGKMNARISTLGLPVNFIFLSDHGMATVDTITRVDIVSRVDTTKFLSRGGSTSLHIYAKDPKYIMPFYEELKNSEKNYKVYLKKDIPSKWHYSPGDDRFNRIGDIFVMPEYPKVLSVGNRRIPPGAHGFDPAIKEMHATFIAWGPAFKKGLTIPSFENVNVYPLICRILGLHYSENIDGKDEVLKNILK